MRIRDSGLVKHEDRPGWLSELIGRNGGVVAGSALRAETRHFAGPHKKSGSVLQSKKNQEFRDAHKKNKSVAIRLMACTLEMNSADA